MQSIETVDNQHQVSSSLTVFNVSQVDFGDYRLIASNANGDSKVLFKLAVSEADERSMATASSSSMGEGLCNTVTVGVGPTPRHVIEPICVLGK